MEDGKQPTPEQIMNLGMAFWGSKTLLSAVEIGLFTELAKEPLDLQTLSERLMLHPRSARDFLDALVALGMLERNVLLSFLPKSLGKFTRDHQFSLPASLTQEFLAEHGIRDVRCPIQFTASLFTPQDIVRSF